MSTPEPVRACLFDAYGTLFDFNSAVSACPEVPADARPKLSEIWRAKQLQYTWLRGLMGRHADFWKVTGAALDYALDSVGLDIPGVHARLMGLYRELDCYPDVPAMLKTLKAAGMRTAILSNGTPEMLAAAVDHAGLSDVMDMVISVEEVGVFKPHPSVYRHAEDRLGLTASEISFQSANAWDAQAAAAFGYRTVWINRTGAPPERLPWPPDAVIPSLAALPALVGAGAD